MPKAKTFPLTDEGILQAIEGSLSPEAHRDAASAEESPAESKPVPGANSASEGSTPAGSTRKSFVDRYGPYPDADTYIAEEASHTNYSGAGELLVSSSTGHRKRVLFNIKPVGLTGLGALQRAVLHIYMSTSTGMGEMVTVNRVTAPWDPATATWESALGGRFDSEATTSIDITSAGWKVVDITPQMREWLEHSAESYGVILTAPTAGEDAASKRCSHCRLELARGRLCGLGRRVLGGHLTAV
jgi:hypothetical protein